MTPSLTAIDARPLCHDIAGLKVKCQNLFATEGVDV